MSHAVGRHAASSNDRPAGLGTRLRAGTTTCSASDPWCSSDRIVRFGSSVSSSFQVGSPTRAWTTTSVPSSVTPAASQPSVIGSRSGARPTPLSDHRSWWLSDAALTVTRAQPSGTVGSGRSPTSSPDSGSSADWETQEAASMGRTLSRRRRGPTGRARAPRPGPPPRRRRRRPARPAGRTATGRRTSADRSSPTTSASAAAAARFMPSLIRGARTAMAPLNTPGKASTLLIWFGKSLRPVATTAAPQAWATSGSTSGTGFAIAKTIESGAHRADGLGRRRCRRTGRCSTSAPRSASTNEPVWRPALLISAKRPLLVVQAVAAACRPCPGGRRSARSPTPASSTIRETAMPAAPAPLTTTRRSDSGRPTSRAALTQRGDDDDRRAVLVVVEDRDVEPLLHPPLDLEAARGADVLEVDAAEGRARAARSSRPARRVSVTSRHSGTASTPPNCLNSSALPSITGSAATGPMSPRPSTAVPSVTTATVCDFHV